MIVTVLRASLAGLFAVTGGAKLLALPSMRRNAAHLGFGANQYRALGALELFGAAGLTQLSRNGALGMAATGALLSVMVGATVAHATRGDAPARVAVPIVIGGGLVVCLLNAL